MIIPTSDHRILLNILTCSRSLHHSAEHAPRQQLPNPRWRRRPRRRRQFSQHPPHHLCRLNRNNVDQLNDTHNIAPAPLLRSQRTTPSRPDRLRALRLRPRLPSRDLQLFDRPLHRSDQFILRSDLHLRPLPPLRPICSAGRHHWQRDFR